MTSTLPNGKSQVFALATCTPVTGGWRASVIKDAGDDPDCTHGAELVATVQLRETVGVELLASEGVATVTKNGLGIDIGAPAITPVPRRSIVSLVQGSLSVAGRQECGARVALSVPGGEEMAKETLNERLGLIGGISILGTTGIVRPYSTAAYRASVVNALDLAAAVGHSRVVLTTGGRTEAYAMRLLPNLGEDAFIEAGDFIGTAVKSCARNGLGGLVVGMIGKLSKMADGRMMTHAAGSKVNLALLAELAKEAGAAPGLAGAVMEANTARHAQDLCMAAGLGPFGTLVCREAAKHLASHAVHSGRRSRIQTLIVGFEGEVLGSWPEELAGELIQGKTYRHE